MRSMLESVRLKSFFEIGALGLALVFTQTGCPGGADLEQPDSYAGRFSTGGTGTGGTGTGGTAPIAGTGTGATAGSGTAGSGTAGTGSGGFDIKTVNCNGPDPVTTLNKKCAAVGCHNSASMASGLILTADAGLATRTKDVPAKHGSIDCSQPGQPFMECTVPPAACPSNALLVNSADWQSSWIISKLKLADNSCGYQMPTSGTLSAQEEACIETIVQAIASSH